MPKQPYRARAEPCKHKRESVLIRQEHSLRISKHGICPYKSHLLVAFAPKTPTIDTEVIK